MSNLKQQIKESPRLVQDELIRLNNRMRELEVYIAELESVTNMSEFNKLKQAGCFGEE